MQAPPIIINRSYKLAASMNSSQVTRLLVLLVAALCLAASSSHAWLQFEQAQMAHHHQMFPASNQRHANIASDFYQAPGANQFLYNQPLNSLAPQQQFLTPSSTSSNQHHQAQATASAHSSEPGAPPLFQAGRLAPPEVAPALAPFAAATSEPATGDHPSAHEQSISARDISQQQQQQVAAAKNQPGEAAAARQDEQLARPQLSNQQQQQQRQDLDIVESPSPLGKILDVVVREGASALLANISHAGSRQSGAPTSGAKDAKPPVVTETSSTSSTTARTSESGEKQQVAPESAIAAASSKQASSQQAVQHLKPTKKSGDKSALNSIEQQIINQHARATSYATLNGRRHEQQQQQQPVAQQQQQQQQHHLRLLPIRHRGDIKLFANLLSSLNHQSASSGASASGADSSSSFSSSSSSSASSTSSKPAPLISALLDNFKSGISSRSSIVKAAMSDNKLARTLSTVGKTIGGNKYVAGAGAAAALAALGLTVSKFLSPYVLAGSYSKLGAGGVSGFEPIMASSSLQQPSFFTGGLSGGGTSFAPDRSLYYQQFQQADPILSAATASNQQYLEPAGSSLALEQSGAISQQAGLVDNTGDSGSIYATYSARPDWLSGSAAQQHFLRPMTSGGGGGSSSSFQKSDPFTSAANGHYSNFYESQAAYEQQQQQQQQQAGASGDLNQFGSEPGAQQQQQFGSYVSGVPSNPGLSASTADQFSELAAAAAAGQYHQSRASSSVDVPSGYQQVDQTAGLVSANSYEPATSSASNQFDQIAQSASSNAPIFVGKQQQQDQLRRIQQQQLGGNYVAPASKSGIAQSGRAASSGSGAAHHRSGAVMLKLDEATRDLIKQQLQAELAGPPPPPPHLNYDFLSSLSSRQQQQQQQQPFAYTDQSSGRAEPVQFAAALSDQRAQQISSAADSSGEYPTFVEWPSSESSPSRQTIKASRFVAGSTNGRQQRIEKSNYAQSTGAPLQQQQQQQLVSAEGQQRAWQQRAASSSSSSNNLAQAMAYNSIRPEQAQTSRNSEPLATATTNTYALIRPKTMQQLVDSSSNAKQQQQRQLVVGQSEFQQQQQQQRELPSRVARRNAPLAQQASAQPQQQQVVLVPIVGTSPSSNVPVAAARDRHEASSSGQEGGRGGWNYAGGQQQQQQLRWPPLEGDKKLAAGSLDLPSVADLSSDQIISESNGAKAAPSSQHQAPTRKTSSSGQLASSRQAENTDNSPWQMSALNPQQSLIRDYEILAAQQQQQQQQQQQPAQSLPSDAGKERPTAGVVDGATLPQAMVQETTPTTPSESRKEKNDNGADPLQQQDELLQVASSMRANLIHLTESQASREGAGGGNGGSEYQVDNEENGASSVNSSPSFDDDKKESERNKLIEAKTNTNNTNDAFLSSSSSSSSASLLLSPAQHDHNQRHISHSRTSEHKKQQQRQDNAQSATETSAGDNVVLELLPNVSSHYKQQRQEQRPPPAMTTTTTKGGGDQNPSLEPKHKQLGDTKLGHQQRAFRGIVAGALGAN